MNINTKHALTEHEHFCFDCAIVKDGVAAIDSGKDEVVQQCTKICDACQSGSEWSPLPGDERYMIPHEDLVKGKILIDEEGHEYEIIDVLTKAMIPSLLHIQYQDGPGKEHIRVEDTVYYSLKELDLEHDGLSLDDMIFCMNGDCSSYWEDSCMRNEKDRVPFNVETTKNTCIENCPYYAAGKHEFYDLDEEDSNV